MTDTDKLNKILDLLSIEAYEIDRAVDKQEAYETLTGEEVDSACAALVFHPIYEKCESIWKTPSNPAEDLCGMSYAKGKHVKGKL